MDPELIMGQTMALVRRYFIRLKRVPIKTLFRFIIIPGLIIGVFGYILIQLSDQPYRGTVISVSGVVFSLTSIHIYSFCTKLVNDKSTKFKSLMISMGLSKISYYLSYVICMLICLLPLTIIAAVFCINYVYIDTQASSISILLIFILFTLQSIAMVFSITSFITSSSFTPIVFVLLFTESLVDQLAIYLCRKSSNWAHYILFTFSFTPYESLRLFSSSYGICKNCDSIETKDGSHQPTWLILLAQLYWTIALFAFSFWFDEVNPCQQDPASQGPCFCLRCSPSNDISDEQSQDMSQVSRFFEKRANNPEEGISIYHLKKSFKNKPAVNDLTIKIYKGETTLLLGHNGAGKTTLMNMILGRLKPDSGYVRTRKHLASSHGLCVGYCPQTSILDEKLSVLQHIELFQDIKSPYDPNRDTNIRTVIQDVSLMPEAHKVPSQLSGGMKRKLSLGMAFIGQSSVLILDEPSSGLDPDSRVFVWNAIRRYRLDRTVLLSTQHMEEADYLGDRIAIMSDGQIVCCGSSLFLNQIFGVGYKLRIECLTSDKQNVLDFVKRHFEQARLATGESFPDDDLDRKCDACISLVTELNAKKSDDSELKLINLLHDLENNPDTSYVKSFGLRSSSIEDVMLNTSEFFKQQVDDKDSTQVTLTTMSDNIEALISPRRCSAQIDQFQRQRRHLLSMLRKNLHTYRINWISTIFYRLFVPISVGHNIVSSLNQGHSTSIDHLFAFVHFVYYPAREKMSKFKIMQLTSNTNFITYWLAHLVIDILTILIAVISMNIFMVIHLQQQILVSKLAFYTLSSLAMMMFGLATAFFCYLFSCVLTDKGSIITYIIVALGVGFAIVQLLSWIQIALAQKVDIEWLSKSVRYIVFALIPTDAYTAIQNGFRDQCYINGRMDPCETATYSGYVWSGFVALIFQIALYGSLLYWVELKSVDLNYYLRRLNCFIRPVAPSLTLIDDDDVKQESEKASRAILQEPNPSISLVASNLSKSHVKGKKAIDGLSFTVNSGECFGLLGVNGAGKTTSFSMLSSEYRPDSGRIRAQGYCVDYDITAYRHKISFDPQSNPKISSRVYDALYLMAELRDIEQTSIPASISSLVRVLDMEKHLWKRASELSGGTMRKLTLGMALIGNPSLLLLDEPTAGIDPVARHGIWTLLRAIRKQNVSIVISSHAMEECEAICDRISILSRGRLRCIGSFLHLRHKFAQGYTIRVQFPDDAENQVEGSTSGTIQLSPIVQALKQHLESRIGQAVTLVDTNINGATFNINDKNIRRSKLFEVMRSFKKIHPSSSYIINDTSLEDIFIKLAREHQAPS